MKYRLYEVRTRYRVITLSAASGAAAERAVLARIGGGDVVESVQELK